MHPVPAKTLQQILDEAQTLPPHERLRFIREACATDSDLYASAMHELESRQQWFGTDGAVAPESGAACKTLRLSDGFRDEADPEHRLLALVQQLHLPFGILLQAARNAAEQVAAHLGHLGPGGFTAFEFGALVGRAGVAATADPKKI